MPINPAGQQVLNTPELSALGFSVANETDVLQRGVLIDMIKNHPDLSGFSDAEKDAVINSITPNPALAGLPATQSPEYLASVSELNRTSAPDSTRPTKNRPITRIEAAVGALSVNAPSNSVEQQAIIWRAQNQIAIAVKQQFDNATSLTDLNNAKNTILSDPGIRNITDQVLKANIIRQIEFFEKAAQMRIQSASTCDSLIQGTYSGLDFPPCIRGIKLDTITSITDLNAILSKIESSSLSPKDKRRLISAIDNQIKIRLSVDYQGADTTAKLSAANASFTATSGKRIVIGKKIDPGTGHVVDISVNALSATSITAINTERDNKTKTLSDTVTAELTVVWNSLASKLNYADAQRAFMNQLDAILNKYGVPGGASGRAALIASGIDVNAISANIILFHEEALSRRILTSVGATPGLTFEAFRASLTPGELTAFGGDAKVQDIFNKLTDPDQLTSYIKSIVTDAVDRNRSEADLRTALTGRGFAAAEITQAISDFNRGRFEKRGQSYDKAADFLQEQFGWNDLNYDGKNNLFTTRRQDIIDLLRAKGLSPSEITYVLDSIDVRLRVEHDNFLNNADVDPEHPETSFGDMQAQIDGNSSLTENQKQVLRSRLQLARESLNSRTDVKEAFLKDVLHIRQEDIDKLRELRIDIKRIWNIISTGGKIILPLLAFTGGGALVGGTLLSGGGLALGLANHLGYWSILSVLGGGAAGAFIGASIGTVPGLFAAATAASKALPEGYDRSRTLNIAKHSLNLAMAERRVANDDMVDLLTKTMGAINHYSSLAPADIAALPPEERQMLEELGVLKGNRFDIQALVGKVASGSQSYARSVGNLRTTFNNHSNQIIGAKDRPGAIQSGTSGLGFSKPNAFVTN